MSQPKYIKNAIGAKITKRKLAKMPKLTPKSDGLISTNIIVCTGNPVSRNRLINKDKFGIVIKILNVPDNLVANDQELKKIIDANKIDAKINVFTI